MDALKDAIKHTITNNHVHEVIMSRMNSITALWAAVAVAAAAVSVTIVITAAPQAAHGVERAVLPAATSTGEAGAAISIERGRYVAQISGCNDCQGGVAEGGAPMGAGMPVGGTVVPSLPAGPGGAPGPMPSGSPVTTSKPVIISDEVVLP